MLASLMSISCSFLPRPEMCLIDGTMRAGFHETLARSKPKSPCSEAQPSIVAHAALSSPLHHKHSVEQCCAAFCEHLHYCCASKQIVCTTVHHCDRLPASRKQFLAYTKTLAPGRLLRSLRKDCERS